MTHPPYYNDPFNIVWDALAERDHGPHGESHNFRSRCALHGDNDTSLHVWDPDHDGVVYLYCHAEDCDSDEILEAIGLTWRDRYPPGYYQSGKRLTPARRSDFTGKASDPANIWLAATQLGIRWSVHEWLDECPSCGWAYFSLAVGSEREPSMQCPRGCDMQMVKQALAERLSDHRRAK